MTKKKQLDLSGGATFKKNMAVLSKRIEDHLAMLKRRTERYQDVLDGKADTRVVKVNTYVVPRRVVAAHERTIIVKKAKVDK